jgi:hypothetical protein
MSGALPSPFPSQNVLFGAASGQELQRGQRNALMMEQDRQNMADADTERVARLSQWMLTESGGDEAKMAALYSQVVPEEQRQGRLRNAPAQFVGAETIRRLASAGISSEKQGEIASNKQGWAGLLGDGTSTGTVPAVTPPAIVTPPSADAPAVVPQQQSSNTRPGGSPTLTSIVAPGGAKITVAQAVAPRFQALVDDLEREGYKLDPATTGGYNPRNIRGTNTPSHHASGNAIDVNWQRNARGANTPSDIPPDLARRLAAKHGLVWGGDWAGETRDPMHFEVVNATRTGGGIEARIPGAYNVAGPPVPAPGRTVAPAALPPGHPLAGLRPDQIQQLRMLQAAGRPLSEAATAIRQFRAQNEQAAQHAQTNARLERGEQRDIQSAAALAEQRRIDNARAGVPTGMQRNAEGVLEPMPGYRGATAEERINYALKNDKPDSQEYADAWRAKKWQMAANGSVIENDMSEYPPPARSVRRPTYLPQPTGTALDEVRKADTDARVIVPSIDRYVDLHKKIGGSSWGAYFDNPKDPKAQQLIGAFNAMKTVLRSPTYANTGVLQPAEMEMLQQELVSPQTIRGLYASPQALEARLHEIKFAILSRQDAELRSVGRDGVIMRSEADLANVPDGGKFYDEDGNLRVKTKAEK